MVKSGSINGVPFGYIKKAVNTSIRNSKSETPGKYGSSIDTMKEGGLDITLDVIAQSPTERDNIVAAFMQEGRGEFFPGNPDTDWKYSGVCGDRSSDFAMSEFNPSVAYPLSFLFQTDLPFMLSRGIKGCGKQITTAEATWSTGDYLPFNTVQNWKFESWTDHDGFEAPDGWTLWTQPSPNSTTISVDSNPQSLAITADGSKLYVANYNENSVSCIDLTTNPPTVSTIYGLNLPIAISISPDGTKAYVANNHSSVNTVSIITLSNNTISTSITVGTSPSDVIFNNAGTKAYVTNYTADTISVIDTSTETASAPVNVGYHPTGVGISTDDSKVYICNYGAGTVTILNTSNLSLVKTLTVGTNPSKIIVHGSKAFVTNYGSQDISVIETSTDTVISTISLTGHPSGITLTTNGQRLFVTCPNENYIYEIDATKYNTLQRIHMQVKPSSVLTYSNNLYSTCDDNNVHVFSPMGILTEITKSENIHKYGSKSLKIVNTNGLPRCGEYYAPVSLEANVEYTFGAWVYNENYNGGEILLELYNGDTSLSSCSGVGLESFTLIKNTYTFDNVPTDIYIQFCVNGAPDDSGLFYIGAVFCIKSDDYSEDMDFTGFIKTTGNVSTVPDFQIDSPRTNENLNPFPTETLINESVFTKTVTQSQILDSNVYSHAFTAPQTATSSAEFTKTFLSPTTVENTSTATHAWAQGDTSTYTYKTNTVNGVSGYSMVLTEVTYRADGDGNNYMTHYLSNGGTRGNVWWHDFGTGNWEVDIQRQDLNCTTSSGSGCTLSLQMSNPPGYATTVSVYSLIYHFNYLPSSPALLKTITITGVADVNHILKSYNYEVKTSNVYAHIDVTVQIGSGTEYLLSSWTTSSTTYVKPSANGYSCTEEAGNGNTLTVRFYGILTNDSGGNYTSDLGGTISIRNCTATYETATDWNLLKTITVPAISNKTRTLTSYSFQGNTSTSGNPAYFKVTVQTPGLEGGVETDLDYWNTSSTSPQTFSYNNMSITSQATQAITLRIYGVLYNGSGGTVYLRNSNAYYGTQPDYGSVVATLTVPATASSARKIIEFGYNAYTTDPSNASVFKVTVQNPNIGTPANTETLVEEWYTTGTSYTTHKFTADIDGDVNTPIYLRIYSKLGNGGLGTLYLTDFYCTYTGGYDTPSGIPQDVRIYNTADPATKLKFCNRLPIGGSMRVNWDSTGFFKYVDDFSTNSYLTVIDASSSEITWEQYNLTIGVGGNLRYDFDVTFPIDNVPYLIFGVVSGTPQIKIAIVTGGVVGTYRSIDGNLTSADTYTVYVKDLINLSTCVLKEETSISIKIEPKATETCVLSYLAFYTDLITIDTERPVIYPDRNNTFAITQTSSALCMLSMAYNDRKWGI